MNEPVPLHAPTVAIVGSGPSGCYMAQFLRRRWPAAEIVVFDRLDVPHGLIRYGVAPDHLGTKAIAKQFERLFERDGVKFAGGIEIGTQVSLESLRAAFDVVVIATGLGADRVIAGFSPLLPGIYGSGRLTRLINGHPDENAEGVRIGARTVIVGAGNVAVDLVRLLLTPGPQLRVLGVADAVIDALTSGPISRIDVVGRSAAHRSKFDQAMVRELAKSPDVRFVCDGPLRPSEAAGDLEQARVDAITELVDSSPAIANRTVVFHFGWAPERAEGTGRVESAVFRAVDGDEELELSVDSICTAIGFTESESATLRRRSLESDVADLGHGRLAEGVYCVGWFRRGPNGTIPANRADARMVAETIFADLGAAGRLAGTDHDPRTAGAEHAARIKELS